MYWARLGVLDFSGLPETMLDFAPDVLRIGVSKFVRDDEIRNGIPSKVSHNTDSRCYRCIKKKLAKAFWGYRRNSMWNFQGLIKKSGISRVDQEKTTRNFQGSWFLILEFPRTQFCGTSRGEAMFCPEFPRVITNLELPGFFFTKVCPQPSPPIWIFSEMFPQENFRG